MNDYRRKNIQLPGNLVLSEISELIKVDNSTPVTTNINHVFCIDVSGSMYSELPKMRQQLKARIPEIISEDDTITIIWFSGRNQCGMMKEMVKVQNLSDVKALNADIDKYLVPMGCTAFAEPIEVTNKLIDNMKSSTGLWSFLFLSDGGHNTGPWSEVITQLTELQPKVSSATIIEYGYYADSNSLSEMAETLGGSKIFEEDFESYSVDIETLLKSKSTPRVEVDITEFKSTMRYQVFFSIDSVTRTIRVYSAERKNTILIPQDTDKLYFLGVNKSKEVEYSQDPSLYAAAFVMADRMKYDTVESILQSTGDTRIISTYCNAFGKQRLESFKNEVLNCVFDQSSVGIDGIDYSFKPSPNAYCVLNMIEELMSSDDNLIHPYHSEFEYSRIGAKSVTKRVLSDEEKEALNNASTKLKADKVMEAIDANSIRMKVTDPSKGYSVSNITWNEDRANLSVLFQIDVTLELPKGNPLGVDTLNSFIFRNYTIIKDGILNMTKLPVTLTKPTKDKFSRRGLLTTSDDGMTILNFNNLPIINKKSTETVYFLDMMNTEMRLLSLRCQNKYLGYLKKLHGISSAVAPSSYSTEQKEWMSSVGINLFKGYSPLTEQDKSGDFYMANSLVTKIDKFSSIPKIEDVLTKRSNNKPMTPSESYLNDQMKLVDEELNLRSVKSDAIDELSKSNTKVTRGLISKLAQSKFSLILSRKWFADKNGFDDNSAEIESLGGLKMSIIFKDEKVYI